MWTDVELWPLAYLGYLVWLCAGLGDFICHRRTDLPHTSGVAESSLHLMQLGLIGIALVLALVYESSAMLAAATLALVMAHAVVGYLDTHSAFGRRIILPVEQHLHSVLDMAPLIAWGGLVAVGWPSITNLDGELVTRREASDPRPWMLVLIPALLLCGLPALLEFKAAWAARAEPGAG